MGHTSARLTAATAVGSWRVAAWMAGEPRVAWASTSSAAILYALYRRVQDVLSCGCRSGRPALHGVRPIKRRSRYRCCQGRRPNPTWSTSATPIPDRTYVYIYIYICFPIILHSSMETSLSFKLPSPIHDRSMGKFSCFNCTFGMNHGHHSPLRILLSS